MKRACRPAAFGAVLAALSLSSRADDPPVIAPPLSPPPTPMGPAPVAAFQPEETQPLDPEALAEQSVAAGEAVRRQQALDSFNAAQKQNAYDNDWLLRDYTAQLQARGLAREAKTKPDEMRDPSAPLAAQLDPLLPPTSPSRSTPKTSDPDSTDASPDASDSSRDKTARSDYLAPLLPPLTGTSKTVERLDTWGGEKLAPAPALGDLPSAGLDVPGVKAIGSSDSNNNNLEMLDVPGLTAEKQGLGDNNGLNLPDEQAESVTENGDNRNRHDFLIPTVASNSSEFFKKQADAMQAPNSFNALHPTVVSMPLSKMPEPAPPPKQPVTTGIRSHVPDPFDLIGGRR